MDLIRLLGEYAKLTPDLIWAYALVFLRVGAAMALLPAFGEQTVPQRVRLALALAFTSVVGPAVIDQIPASEFGFVQPVATETLIGLTIGISLRLMIMALQIAGSIAAQASSLSQMVGGIGPEPQPALTNLLVMAALALAVAAGLHVRLAQLLIGSYSVLPAGAFPNPRGIADWGLYRIGLAFSLAFSLAAAFSIAALLYNVLLGVINRAMPALMVSFIGAPALAGGGLVLLMLCTPAMLHFWLGALSDFLQNPFRITP